MRTTLFMQPATSPENSRAFIYDAHSSGITSGLSALLRSSIETLAKAADERNKLTFSWSASVPSPSLAVDILEQRID